MARALRLLAVATSLLAATSLPGRATQVAVVRSPPMVAEASPAHPVLAGGIGATARARAERAEVLAIVRPGLTATANQAQNRSYARDAVAGADRDRPRARAVRAGHGRRLRAVVRRSSARHVAPTGADRRRLAQAEVRYSEGRYVWEGPNVTYRRGDLQRADDSRVRRRLAAGHPGRGDRHPARPRQRRTFCGGANRRRITARRHRRGDRRR